MKGENKTVAMTCLKMAIQNRCSEVPINHYIKFMDSLPKKERNEILKDDDITRLVDRINRMTECEIELHKSRRNL